MHPYSCSFTDTFSKQSQSKTKDHCKLIDTCMTTTSCYSRMHCLLIHTSNIHLRTKLSCRWQGLAANLKLFSILLCTVRTCDGTFECVNETVKAGTSEWAEQAVTCKLACCGSRRPIQSLVHNVAQQVGSFCSHGHLPAHCSLCLLSLLGLGLSTLQTPPQNMGVRWEEVGGGRRGQRWRGRRWRVGWRAGRV